MGGVGKGEKGVKRGGREGRGFAPKVNMK